MPSPKSTARSTAAFKAAAVRQANLLAIRGALSVTHSKVYSEIDRPAMAEHAPHLDIDKLVAGTNPTIWFRCDGGPDHAWHTGLKERTKDKATGCPFCSNKRLSVTNNLAVCNAEVALDLDVAKAGVTADQIIAGSGKKMPWTCHTCAHEWTAQVMKRTRDGHGCPACSGKVATATANLAVNRGDLARTWDFPGNAGSKYPTPDTVTAGSERLVWWVCEQEGHSYRCSPASRARGAGCNICTNRTVTADNCVAATHADIAAEIHEILNTVKPTEIVAGSDTKLFFVCSVNPLHCWQAALSSRTRNGSGCPVCKRGWRIEVVRATILHLAVSDKIAGTALVDGNARHVAYETLGLLTRSAAWAEPMKAHVEGTMTFAELFEALGGVLAEFEEQLDKVEGPEDAAAGDLPAFDLAPAGASVVLDPHGMPALADTVPLLEGSNKADTDGLYAPGAIAALRALDGPFPLASLLPTAEGTLAAFFTYNALNAIWVDASSSERRFRQVRELVAEFSGDEFANLVRDLWLEEAGQVAELDVPEDYDFTVDGQPVSPFIMQKLTAVRLASNRRVANWSGTGAGKTGSALLAAGTLEAKTTLIVCPNSVVSNWRDNIENFYPGSDVTLRLEDLRWAHRPGRQFLVLNYEQFQQSHSRAQVQALLAAGTIDLLVFDEIHNIKEREGTKTSHRKLLLTETTVALAQANPALAVLALTATPLLNSLSESRSLLEVLHGEHKSDLGTRATRGNCLAMAAALLTCGLRLSGERVVPHIRQVRIDASDAREQIIGGGVVPGVSQIERALLPLKLDAIAANIDGPTIVYTQFVDGMVAPIVTDLQARGMRVGQFTGIDKSGLQQFRERKVDVLVASSPISTGVDGLQKFCSRMIVACLPWTAAEFEQLQGRIARKGQVRPDEVEIVILVTEIATDDSVWSWERQRLARIDFKQTLASAAVDGQLSGDLALSEQSLTVELGRLVAQMTDQLDDGILTPIPRRPLETDLVADDSPVRAPRHRGFTEFNLLNQRMNAGHAETTAALFAEQPEIFERYQDLNIDARSRWGVVPAAEAIKLAGAMAPGSVIADFGCGRAELARTLHRTHTVHSFDHVASNEHVTAGNMAHTPMADATVDLAVFSLSLMGARPESYLVEARRVLKHGGLLSIWLPTKQIKDREMMTLELASLGFTVADTETADRFTHILSLATEQALPGARFTFGAPFGNSDIDIFALD